MATIVKRVVGVLLALVGLALTVVGVWFAAQLGTLGHRRVHRAPGHDRPVLVGPDVLNRVDADVVVTATPTDGGSVWMALANPSDADAVVGDSKHVAVTGVSVSDWTLLTTTTGTGTAPELGAADLWRQQDDAEGPVTLTVRAVRCARDPGRQEPGGPDRLADPPGRRQVVVRRGGHRRPHRPVPPRRGGRARHLASCPAPRAGRGAPGPRGAHGNLRPGRRR